VTSILIHLVMERVVYLDRGRICSTQYTSQQCWGNALYKQYFLFVFWNIPSPRGFWKVLFWEGQLLYLVSVQKSLTEVKKLIEYFLNCVQTDTNRTKPWKHPVNAKCFRNQVLNDQKLGLKQKSISHCSKYYRSRNNWEHGRGTMWRQHSDFLKSELVETMRPAKRLNPRASACLGNKTTHTDKHS
jgi:hypothetical protein